MMEQTSGITFKIREQELTELLMDVFYPFIDIYSESCGDLDNGVGYAYDWNNGTWNMFLGFSGLGGKPDNEMLDQVLDELENHGAWDLHDLFEIMVRYDILPEGNFAVHYVY